LEREEGPCNEYITNIMSRYHLNNAAITLSTEFLADFQKIFSELFLITDVKMKTSMQWRSYDFCWECNTIVRTGVMGP
jgi:hypothetical protein